MPDAKATGLAYSKIVLGNGANASATKPPPKAANTASAIAERAKADETASPELINALDMARDGDDSALLPYQPTPSINPPRPRTLAAGYDPKTRTLRVRFRDGTPWQYFDVSPEEWRNFRRVKSPGRYINRVLNAHPYARGDF
jgi:hypothetical protein